jgi:uncharacterized protein
MFPLGMVVFPHQVVGLCVFEPRYQQMLIDLDASATFGTCLIERGSEVGGGDERSRVGTLMRIIATQQMPDGKTLLMVEGEERIVVEEWLADAPYPRARIGEPRDETTTIDPGLLRSTESAVRALRSLQSEVVSDHCLKSNCEMDPDPWVRSWQLCSMTPMSIFDQFAVLRLSDPNDRLRLVAEICCERYGDYQRMLALD